MSAPTFEESSYDYALLQRSNMVLYMPEKGGRMRRVSDPLSQADRNMTVDNGGSRLGSKGEKLAKFSSRASETINALGEEKANVPKATTKLQVAFQGQVVSLYLLVKRPQNIHEATAQEYYRQLRVQLQVYGRDQDGKLVNAEARDFASQGSRSLGGFQHRSKPRRRVSVVSENFPSEFAAKVDPSEADEDLSAPDVVFKIQAQMEVQEHFLGKRLMLAVLASPTGVPGPVLTRDLLVRTPEWGSQRRTDALFGLLRKSSESSGESPVRQVVMDICVVQPLKVTAQDVVISGTPCISLAVENAHSKQQLIIHDIQFHLGTTKQVFARSESGRQPGDDDAAIATRLLKDMHRSFHVSVPHDCLPLTLRPGEKYYFLVKIERIIEVPGSKGSAENMKEIVPSGRFESMLSLSWYLHERENCDMILMRKAVQWSYPKTQKIAGLMATIDCPSVVQLECVFMASVTLTNNSSSTTQDITLFIDHVRAHRVASGDVDLQQVSIDQSGASEVLAQCVDYHSSALVPVDCQLQVDASGLTIHDRQGLCESIQIPTTDLERWELKEDESRGTIHVTSGDFYIFELDNSSAFVKMASCATRGAGFENSPSRSADSKESVLCLESSLHLGRIAPGATEHRVLHFLPLEKGMFEINTLRLRQTDGSAGDKGQQLSQNWMVYVTG